MSKYVLPTEGRITQTFDTPVNYIAGRNHHEAIDLVTSGAKPLIALDDGVIQKVIDGNTEATQTGYGNQVYIAYNHVEQTDRFCHMRYRSSVKAGQKVAQGDLLGYTGRTGYRYPLSVYHTHWESFVDGRRVDPLTSPLQWYLENPKENQMKEFTGVRQSETGEIIIHPEYKDSDPIALTLSIQARMNNQPLLKKSDAKFLKKNGWITFKNIYATKKDLKKYKKKSFSLFRRKK